MPGPTSDSFDPEFGTGENADRVRRQILNLLERLNLLLGAKRPILEVIAGDDGATHLIAFTERELRILRFAVARAEETI